jgi:hypothetical protein
MRRTHSALLAGVCECLCNRVGLDLPGSSCGESVSSIYMLCHAGEYRVTRCESSGIRTLVLLLRSATYSSQASKSSSSCRREVVRRSTVSPSGREVTVCTSQHGYEGPLRPSSITRLLYSTALHDAKALDPMCGDSALLMSAPAMHCSLGTATRRTAIEESSSWSTARDTVGRHKPPVDPTKRQTTDASPQARTRVHTS